MTIPLPPPVLRALSLLNEAGHEAYAVGGCVRDCLMGRTPADWDITTSALPQQTAAVFAGYRTIDTGIRHGTVTVLIENTPLEITTYRVDGTYSDGRRPDKVTFTPSLSEDLRRRDFTVNAMAFHPDGGLVDLFGGRQDICSRTICCVGVPSERFTEDALRILRALRFSSILGFSMDAATAEAVHRLSPHLSKVSVERITAEWKRLLCAPYAEHILTEFSDVIAVFLPEIRTISDFSLLSAVRPLPHARLAALFHTADLSADEAISVLRRLRFDAQTMHRVQLLLTARVGSIYTEDSYILRLLNHLGAELVFDYFAIKQVDATTIQRAQKLLDEGRCYQLSSLAVSGDDVVAAGIHAGPSVGETLQELLLAVMDGVCPNQKEALLAYMQASKKPVQ